MSVDPADAIFPCLSTRFVGKLSTYMRAHSYCTSSPALHPPFSSISVHPSSPSGPLPSPAQSLCVRIITG